MSDIITTKNIGAGISDVEQYFVLSEEPMSRLVFQAQIHNKGIRGKIIRQRRESANDSWIPDKAIPIKKVELNEFINIEMKTEAISKFYTAISKLSGILKSKGIEYGENEYTVVDPDSVVITDENKAIYIRKIIDAGYNENIWHDLAESNPSLVTKLSYARIFSERKKVLEEFSISLESEQNESYWQNFFKLNSWIFGYGLKYQFLNLITDQPSYSGAAYDRSGEQKGDYLMNSEAEKRFTLLVEIKKPQTNLVLSEKYRNGAWKLGEELLWATSQTQINCLSWFKDGSTHDRAKDELETHANIFTYQPKGILVIGHTKQLDNRDKIQTFQAYRSNLQNPEIITFDELYERAKFIVETNEKEIKNTKIV